MSDSLVRSVLSAIRVSTWLASSQYRQKRAGSSAHNDRPWFGRERLWMAWRLSLCGWALFFPQSRVLYRLLLGYWPRD